MACAGGDSFDPDTIALMRRVLDDTWNRLSPGLRARTQKSDVARIILKMGARGERDPARLRVAAIMELVGGPSRVPDTKTNRRALG
jgi:hypothetical protein